MGDTNSEYIWDLDQDFFLHRELHAHNFDKGANHMGGINPEDQKWNSLWKTRPNPANKFHFIYEWHGNPEVDWPYEWNHEFDWLQFELLYVECPNCSSACLNSVPELGVCCDGACFECIGKTSSVIFYKKHGISDQYMSHRELLYIHNLLNLRYKCAMGTGTVDLPLRGRTVKSTFRTGCTQDGISRYLVLSKWINTQIFQPQNKWVSVHWYCKWAFMLKVHAVGWLVLVLLPGLPVQISSQVPVPKIGEWIYANPLETELLDYGLDSEMSMQYMLAPQGYSRYEMGSCYDPCHLDECALFGVSYRPFTELPMWSPGCLGNSESLSIQDRSGNTPTKIGKIGGTWPVSTRSILTSSSTSEYQGEAHPLQEMPS